MIAKASKLPGDSEQNVANEFRRAITIAQSTALLNGETMVFRIPRLSIEYRTVVSGLPANNATFDRPPEEVEGGPTVQHPQNALVRLSDSTAEWPVEIEGESSIHRVASYPATGQGLQEGNAPDTQGRIHRFFCAARDAVTPFVGWKSSHYNQMPQTFQKAGVSVASESMESWSRQGALGSPAAE
jgi:hypothetical protein